MIIGIKYDKIMKYNFLILLCAFFFEPSSAHAYIDPGTGALIVQALIAGFITAIATIKFWWHGFIGFFKKDKDEDKPLENSKEELKDDSKKDKVV